MAPLNPIPFAQEVIEKLVSEGRGPELEHPNASPYWTGAHDDIRYICQFCASWFDTASEVEAHLEEEH